MLTVDEIAARALVAANAARPAATALPAYHAYDWREAYTDARDVLIREHRPDLAASWGESFDASQDDWWVCACGNHPGAGGHVWCTPTGEPTEPVTDEWQGHYLCVECGRFGTYTDRDPFTGRVPAVGRREDVAALLDAAYGAPVGASS